MLTSHGYAAKAHHGKTAIVIGCLFHKTADPRTNFVEEFLTVIHTAGGTPSRNSNIFLDDSVVNYTCHFRAPSIPPAHAAACDFRHYLRLKRVQNSSFLFTPDQQMQLLSRLNFPFTYWRSKRRGSTFSLFHDACKQRSGASILPHHYSKNLKYHTEKTPRSESGIEGPWQISCAGPWDTLGCTC